MHNIINNQLLMLKLVHYFILHTYFLNYFI